MLSHKKTPGPSEDVQSPLYKLGPAKLSVAAGLLLLCYGITGLSLGLVFLDSCPRHPLLSVWLVTISLVTALLSLLLLGLPACTKKNTVTTAPAKLTRTTIALMFVSSLVIVLVVVSLVSWLSVGTFWLAHSRIRLEVEQEEECSLTLLVITGITVFLSWTGLLSGLTRTFVSIVTSFLGVIFGIWRGIQFCDCSRGSYFPTRRRRLNNGYVKMRQRPVMTA